MGKFWRKKTIFISIFKSPKPQCDIEFSRESIENFVSRI